MNTGTPEKQTSIFAAFWDLLSAPNTSIQGITERRRARLSSAISLAFALLTLIGFSVTATMPGGGGGSWIFIITAAVAILTYILSRTKYFFVSALVLVLGLSAISFINILAGSSSSSISNSLYVFIPLALIIGSSLLSPWALIIVTLINFLAILLLNTFGITDNVSKLVPTAGIILTMGILLAILDYYRTLTERNRLKDLEKLNKELTEMRINLEERVQERTKSLDRRSAQLEASAYVSRQTAAIQDPKFLLEEVVNLISARFGYYHAGIFLIDERGRNAVLQAASSEGGKRLIARGHKLEVGREGIVGYAAYQKKSRIALDVGADARFFNNPDLPETRSEVALPLSVRNRVIGILDIQSSEPNAFSQEDISALESMADQVALAIENGRLLTESQFALKQLQAITAESTYRTWKKRLEEQSKGFVYNPTNVSPINKSKKEAFLSEEGVSPLVIPLMLRGTKIGDIKLARKGNSANWTEEEMQFANEIATQTALAVDSTRLLEDSQFQAVKEQTIGDMTTRLSQTTDLDALLKQIVQEFHQLPGVTESSIFIGQTEIRE
jgi:GAF domain-containing protein